MNHLGRRMNVAWAGQARRLGQDRGAEGGVLSLPCAWSSFRSPPVSRPSDLKLRENHKG